MRADESISASNTHFIETPKIPPSSLAFFISDIARTNSSRNPRIKHNLAIRESELESTQIFFDATNELLLIVESFMDFNLAYDTLHHVTLMDLESDIVSFYAFNYYR
jgi:hypothetical protein